MTFGAGENQAMGSLERSRPISFVYDSKMQCSSCHDVHQQAVDADKSLRVKELRS